MSGPKISIIVPCRNEAGYIAGFLRNVLDQQAPPGGWTLEVIVADGMSDDATRETIESIAADDPRVRLVDNPDRIVSTGLNRAIRASRGDIIVRMDVHTAYAPDYLLQCVSALESTGADNVGGPWVARGDGFLSRAVAAAFQSPFATGPARGHDPDYEGPLDTVYLGCWRREVFDRVGLFDEELVRNQDDEFNLRLKLAGGTVWQSARIRSWYTPRSSLKALFRQYFQYGYWKIRVIQKHRRPASIRHIVPVLFVAGVSLGWLAGFAYAPLWWLYGAVMAAYGLLSLAFSARAALASGWDLLAVLPVVFLTYHAGYGAGCSLGIVDFAILRRGGRASMAALTRVDRQHEVKAPE